MHAKVFFGTWRIHVEEIRNLIAIEAAMDIRQ